MEDQILKILGTVGWPGSSALAVFLLYRAGVFTALAARLTKYNGEHEARIEKIETNDLVHLQADMNDMKVAMRDVEHGLSEVAQKVARIEGKIYNNGTTKF